MYVDGEVMVAFKDGVTEEQARQLIKSLGLSVKEEREFIHMLVVEVPVGEEFEWSHRFMSHSIVKSAGVNFIMKPLKE